MSENILLFFKQVRLTLFYIQVNNVIDFFAYVCILMKSLQENFMFFMGEKSLRERFLKLSLNKNIYFEN